MQFSAANGHIQVYGLQRSLKDDRRIKEPMLQDEKRGESQLSYAVTESTSLRVSLLMKIKKVYKFLAWLVWSGLVCCG